MVNYQSKARLDSVFHSLSDPIRRDILFRIAEKEITVTELAKPYRVSLPAISRHLKVMEQASLIKRKKYGREHKIVLNPQPLQEAEKFIAFYRTFWNTQLDNLEEYLKKTNNKKNPRLKRR